MSISILNRGASGGLKPELTVIAPSGSTIDLLQNGIIIDTYTLGASETEHTFVVKVGTYTVKGTLGTNTASEEIAIDIAGQYKVEIDYKLWLYREGDECTDITGGWSAGWTYGGGGSITKNSDHFVVYAAYGQNAKGCETNHKVSIDGYAYLKAEVVPVDCNSGGTHPNELWLYAINTRGTWSEIEHCTRASHVNKDDTENSNLPLGEIAVITYDISALSGSKYVGLASYGGNHWKVNRVWLE